LNEHGIAGSPWGGVRMGTDPFRPFLPHLRAMVTSAQRQPPVRLDFLSLIDY
jgi:hypothetical protein